jgi:RHS repeat-associated protein
MILFPDDKEENAYVFSSIRRSATDKTKDPSVKYLRTKDEKELKCAEKELSFSGKEKNTLILMDDDKGIEIYSKNEIRITSDKALNIIAKDAITLSSGSKIELSCKGSSFVMDDSTITIKSPEIHKNIGSPANVSVAKSGGSAAAHVGKSVPVVANTLQQLSSLGTHNFDKGKQCAGGDPINMATGNFVTDTTDIELPGNVPIVFTRTYNSCDSRSGVLGKGWRHNYEMFLEKQNDEEILITFNDGHVEKFNIKGTSSEPKQGRIIPLEKDEFQLLKHDGSSYRFNPQGQIISIKNNQGEITLGYDKGRLSLISSKSGQLHLSYNEKGLLGGLTDHAKRTILYVYADSFLTGYSDVDGSIHDYAYDDNGRLNKIIDAIENVYLHNIYDEKNRVIEQTMADGGKGGCEYDDENRATISLERNGSRILYFRDDKDRIFERKYPNGRERLTFDDKGQVTKFIDKKGNVTFYDYDAAGNIIRETDALGQKKEFTYGIKNNVTSIKNPDNSNYLYDYDPDGNLLSAIDPLGRTTRLKYQQGLPVSVVLANGSQYTFEYDAKGNPFKVTDPEGGVFQYGYDDLNRVTTIIKPEGNLITYEYIPSGKIKKITYPDGSEVKAKYDPCGFLCEETDESGAVTKYKYNNIGKLSEKIDALGGITKYEYTPMWEISKITKPDGSIIQYEYDANNHLASIIDEAGNIRNYTYDDNGNLIEEIDPLGNTTAYQYDRLDRVVRIVNANNAVTQYEYRYDGKIQKVIDALKGITEYGYDAAGQVVQVKDASGAITKYTYNALGYVETVTDPNGNISHYEYNAAGKIIKVTHPDNAVERLQYDKNGNLIAHIDALGNQTRYTYDQRDRLISVINAAGGIKKAAYTANGKLAAITDENGNTTEYGYDPLGRLSEVKDPTGGKTAYVYALSGNVAEVHRYAGISAGSIAGMNTSAGVTYQENLQAIIIKYKYDKRGLLQEEQYPDKTIITYTYDANGNLLSKTDQASNQTKYEYDAINNLSKITYADSRTVEYQRDPLGRITTMIDWLGELNVELDPLGRILKATDYQNRTTEYAWTPAGEKSAIIYPDGSKAEYLYDRRGRLSQVVDTQGKTIQFKYDAAGNLIEKRQAEDLVTAYSYDPLSRITQLSTRSRKESLDDYSYAYDAAGNKIKAERCRNTRSVIVPNNEETIGISKYRYDALNQLIEIKKPNDVVEKYFYDTLGNRVRQEKYVGESLFREALDYQYDVRNQLTAITAHDVTPGAKKVKETVMEYDERGNLSKTIIDGTISAEYNFDAANRLARAANAQAVSQYTYDGLGRRVKQSIEHLTLPEPQTMSEFRRLNWENSEVPRIPEEYEYLQDSTAQYNDVLMSFGPNGEKSRYTYAMGKAASVSYWEPLTEKTEYRYRHLGNRPREAEELFFFTDDLGSPIRITDSRRESRAFYSYDSFGKPVTEINKEDFTGNIFGFTGYQNDRASGMQYANARYYQPNTARFVSEDPVQHGENWYVYGKNNPFKYVDPMGLMACPPSTAGNPVKGTVPKPKAVTFEGKIYRSVSGGLSEKEILSIHDGNIAANHRYTKSGVGGLYFSTDEATVKAELDHWKVPSDGRVMFSKDVKIDNMLDLTNAKTRRALGIKLKDIMGDSYKVTHKIGDFAKSNGYNGIIAPSARSVGGVNLIVFNPSSIL